MKTPTPKQVATALASTAELAKKRDAAPSWADLGATFGEQGFVRNKRGKITGYKYPKHRDPAKSASVAKQAYEMWEPHRRVSTAQGSERNAQMPMTTLISRKTGRREVVPSSVAERKARKADLVEVSRLRGKTLLRIDSNGVLWRLQGDDYVRVEV